MESLWQDLTIDYVEKKLSERPIAREYINRLFNNLDDDTIADVFEENGEVPPNTAAFLFACGQEWNPEHPITDICDVISGTGTFDVTAGPESLYSEYERHSPFEEAIERARCLFFAMVGLPFVWAFDNEFEEEFPVKP